MKIGFRANYNLRNTVNVELKGAYNGWNVDQELQAWNKPQWEASLNTAVRINRNLNVSVIGFYESGCFAKMGASAVALNPKIDINLGASYLFNSWFTGFAKINNLINNPYQYYYGYDVQGLNVMVGGAVSF
jgi:outer membrane cobalamin receptor